MEWQSVHEEPHRVTRSGWLRAAVLGGNDGIVSISALIVGVAAAQTEPRAILVAGFAGLAAGAMSMAAGEYVSVSSQADVEAADIAREKIELVRNPEAEHEELASIYRARGLSAQTADQVARELAEHDALEAHIRDEMGLSEVNAANPVQAALTSGLTFTIAGSVPLGAAVLAPTGAVIPIVVLATILALATLGGLGAHAGGAPLLRAILRVVFWGGLAMAVTALVGRLFGAF